MEGGGQDAALANQRGKAAAPGQYLDLRAGSILTADRGCEQFDRTTLAKIGEHNAEIDTGPAEPTLE